MMEERDDLRKQDPASPRLSTMNDEITKATSDHKRRQWREFVESIDHRTDSSKLWRTIKGIDGKSKQTAENEGITFTGRSHTSPKLIANSFNRQFITSKLGKHSSSRRTRHVSKDVKRMSLEQAESFTSDQVTSAIKSCRSSRAYGPDTLSIFHLKNLGPLATEHLTALYNDSLKSCRLPSIWKTSLVIPIPKPGKDSSQGTSYRPISLLCPAAKVLEALILPSINEFLSPAKDQHGFRPRHSTTSALLQLTTDIETGFNQRKPPHRTVCVAIDLTAAFDTVSHDTLISKIVGSSLPPAITRWLSCYLRGRQAATSFRGTKSSTRIVRTSVPQGSKLSPSLFNYYIADMPRPTPPVKRVWETLLMTYKAVGRSIINYAAPVWSPNLHDTNYRKIKYTQNEALRIATGCHKMSSVDHLHTEAEMLKVREHSELLSAQYLARCLEPGNVCHPITTRAAPERRMKETLYTKHRNTVEPMMVKNDRKATLQALHTDAVDKAVRSQERNVVLDGRPPPISSSEKELSRRERSTLAQLRSGHCRLLGSYKSRIKKDASLNVCSDCGTSPHDVTHLFTCPAHPTTMIPSDLWNRPTDIVRELNYLEARDPN